MELLDSDLVFTDIKSAELRPFLALIQIAGK